MAIGFGFLDINRRIELFTADGTAGKLLETIAPGIAAADTSRTGQASGRLMPSVFAEKWAIQATQTQPLSDVARVE